MWEDRSMTDVGNAVIIYIINTSRNAIYIHDINVNAILHDINVIHSNVFHQDMLDVSFCLRFRTMYLIWTCM
jgi:hypothetical protein